MKKDFLLKNIAKSMLRLILFMFSIKSLMLTGAIISHGDKKVHKTVIAADESNKNIIVFWTSESIKKLRSRVGLAFNSSTDGGKLWLKKPIPFSGNAKSRWVNDFLPMLSFDKEGFLHVVWLQADNRTSPRYSVTKDLGKNWISPVIIGKVKAISRSGVALGIDYSRDNTELNPFVVEENDEEQSESRKRIWAMYDEYRLRGVMVEGQGDKWHNVPVKVARTRNLAGEVKHALQHGSERYVLRLQKQTALCLMRYKDKKWSTYLLAQSKQPIDVAARHSLAMDSKGAIYVVFSEQGKLNCLYMECFGSKVGKIKLPELKGNIKAPVVAVSEQGLISIICQVVSEKNKSRIAYTSTRNNIKSWSKFKFLKNSGSRQSFPDAVVIDDKMIISYTEDKQAAVAIVTDIPK